MANETLEGFLDRWLAQLGAGDSLFQLVSVAPDGQEGIIDTWPGPISPGALIDAIDDATAREAGAGGVGSFALAVLSAGATLARYRFAAAAPDRGGLAVSEPATAAGIAAQLMRHNESLHKLVNMGVSGALTAQNETIAQLQNANRAYAESHASWVAEREAAASQRIEMLAELSEGDARSALFERGLQMLAPLVPELLARVQPAPQDPPAPQEQICAPQEAEGSPAPED